MATPKSTAVAAVDMKLEVIVLPVTDVDRAKKFYLSLGWRLDADRSFGDQRVVQVTPPGSLASIQFGKGLTNATPGSFQGLFLVVWDLEAARAALREKGADVSEPYHRGKSGPEQGLDPQRASYNSFASFKDPDGNRWLLQEVTQRLPGRMEPETEYSDPADLAGALRRAEAAHGKHEQRTGQRDENWPDWYAKFMVSEQSGEAPPP
jgi:catechol 2,3-dioxygenase-like lactoylglutathione lyase family enzyme